VVTPNLRRGGNGAVSQPKTPFGEKTYIQYRLKKKKKKVGITFVRILGLFMYSQWGVTGLAGVAVLGRLSSVRFGV